MDIFSKCSSYTLARECREKGIYPYFHALESKQDTVVIMEGARRIMLGSNNYLGLTINPDVIAAAAEEDAGIMNRVVDSFRGFLDCLEKPAIKGTVFCSGVWHVGEIEGNPALQEAYEMGKRV